MLKLVKMQISLLLAILFFSGCIHTKKTYYQLTHEQEQLARKLSVVTDDYLTKKFGKTGFGGEKYCAYKVLDIENTEKEVNEYLYAVCQEVYLTDGHLTKGTGIGGPVALYLQQEGETYKVLGHKIPRDGSMNSRDIKAIFPARIQEEIFAQIGGPDFWSDEIEKKANTYFHIPTKK